MKTLNKLIEEVKKPLLTSESASLESLTDRYKKAATIFMFPILLFLTLILLCTGLIDFTKYIFHLMFEESVTSHLYSSLFILASGMKIIFKAVFG
jgi:hypothetical protein